MNYVLKIQTLHERNTLFIGKVFLTFSALASTNTYALELLGHEKPVEGTVIHAENQTEGRGQMGNRWLSDAGKNITLSVIVYPQFLPAKQQFQLNEAIALAVRDCVAKYVEKPVIVKWPNDVYIEERKVAGILIQNTLSGAQIQSSVIGIGINVNQRDFAADLPNPTSISLEKNAPCNIKEVINELLYRIETRYLALKQGHTQAMHDEYLSHLYRYQKPARYWCADGRLINGQIVGVDSHGRLLIEHSEGIEAFDLKGVKPI